MRLYHHAEFDISVVARDQADANLRFDDITRGVPHFFITGRELKESLDLVRFGCLAAHSVHNAKTFYESWNESTKTFNRQPLNYEQKRGMILLLAAYAAMYSGTTIEEELGGCSL